jgi:small nuclear ribonucleoprotein (snRNP)-like protein
MEAYQNCLYCMDKKVRILTMDRKEYRGTVVKVDYQNVYLRPEANYGTVRTSGFFPFFNNEIITLSLFTLLAIALI